MDTVTYPTGTVITDGVNERFVREPHDHVYVANATLAAPLEGTKVRVSIRRNSYDFQCSAKADVLDRVHPVWNTVVTRSPSEVGAVVPFRYSGDYSDVQDACGELAAELIREVFDLLV